ncbi:holin [Variovorax sp. LjRoot130]|jgi:hypothetical protein|uniref:holin n=1 Tax=Variovorax sp. LjRoot130 TaxID=3342261 RepID=UPI003ECF958D
MSREAIEATVAAAGSKVTYTGAGASVASWLLSSEFGVAAGLLLGIAGLLVNIYFKRQENLRQQARDEREKEEHQARMRRLERSEADE